MMSGMTLLRDSLQDFELKDNTLSREVKDSDADRIQLEIGDSKRPTEALPQAKVMRWNNEVNLSVRRVMDMRGVTSRTEGEHVVFDSAKEEVHIYEKPDIAEDGGLEIEIHLKEKPTTNRFDFTIQTKGLNFYYQPALTKEEMGGSNDSFFHDEILHEILKLNPKRVLDTGAGAGWLVDLLVANGIDAVGVDVVDTDNERVQKIDVSKGLPFRDDEFDLVVGVGFLKHIKPEDVGFVVSEIKRVSKQGLFFIGKGLDLPKGATKDIYYDNVDFWSKAFDDSAYSFQKVVHKSVEQPENVIGSYAVYHATKKNNCVGGKEYKTGKFCHIYRPHITDADGNETWGELEIDEEAGILTVVVPESFLDNAVYPVVVDPTFGYTTAGGSNAQLFSTSYGSITRYIRGSYFNLTENGNVSKLTARINYWDTDDRYTAAIYTKTSGDDVFVVKTSEVSGEAGTDKWYDLAITDGESLLSGDYWLVVWGNRTSVGNGQSANFRFDTSGSSIGGVRTESGYSTFPDPWAPTAESRQYSIYATYTESSDGPTKIKISGTFEPVTTNIKLSGTFVEKTMKVKVGGSFV